MNERPTPIIKPCPVCGRRPDIDDIGWRAGEDLGWYANCYGEWPREHNVGTNADTRRLVIEAWNALPEHSAPAPQAQPPRIEPDPQP